MKNLSLTLCVLASFLLGISFSSLAQSSQEEIDLVQASYGMNKKEMIAAFLLIEESNPFWAVYDQYELERKDLGQKRIDLIKKYAENYTNLSDEDIAAYMSEMMKLKKSTDKLIDTYYGKTKKVSGAKIASQFYEFENYLLCAIRIEIMDNIPFFGELDKE